MSGRGAAWTMPLLLVVLASAVAMRASAQETTGTAPATSAPAQPPETTPTQGAGDVDPGTQTGGPNVGGTSRPQDPELVARGRRLYEVACSSCHGLHGRGAAQGPTLVGVGAASAHFYLSTGRMPMDEPDVQARRKRPAYTREEIRALTAYVASLGDGPPIPDIDPSTGDLALGSQLYAINCAACHNSAASGGALGQAIYAPGLGQSTTVQLAEAIRVGPGAMPVFGPDTLSDHQVASIIRYIEYLGRDEERGGLPLGRVGPVPEGVVAWIVGLGAMLLAAFWIGTRE